MDYKDVLENLFSYIELDLKVEIIDKNYMNLSEVNDICHFSVKGIEDFRFCIERSSLLPTESYDSEYRNTDFIWYAQTRNEINKFKFSRSAYKGWIKYYDCDFEWNYFTLRDTILFMKKHKYVAYYIGALDYGDLTDYMSPIKCFIFTLRSKFNVFKEKLVNKYIKARIIHYIKLHYSKIEEVKCLLRYGGDSHSYLYFYVYDNDVIDGTDSDYKLNKYDRVLDEKYFSNLTIRYVRDKQRFDLIVNRELEEGEINLWKKN